MKFSFKSFAIGFGCAALSIGAVTFANAAGDATLKACANKSTGAMRYISKGSCKKTETSLSWSQMGPQGLPGVAGPAGSAGINGAAGPSWKWVDANGNQIGDFIDYSGGKFMYNGMIYQLNSLVSNGYQSNYGSFFYTDSACTIPKGLMGSVSPVEALYTAAANNPDATPRTWWRATGIYGTISAGDTFYFYNDSPGGSCVLYTVRSAPTADVFRGATYSEVSTYSGGPPTYVAPVLIARN